MSPVRPLDSEDLWTIKIAVSNATVTWPQERRPSESRSLGPSVTATPSLRDRFVLRDLTFNLPMGELTLICGKLGKWASVVSFLSVLTGETFLRLGSGKTLLLLGMQVFRRQSGIITS